MVLDTIRSTLSGALGGVGERISGLLTGTISLGEEASIKRETIAGIVAAWFFGAILSAAETAIGFYFSAIEAINDAIVDVGGALQAGLAPIGSAPLALVGVLSGSIESIASVGGPFAPALVVVSWGLVVIGLLVLIERSIGLVIRVIPVL
ncbi:hypothetical protein [Natronomonas sp. LN261]|uniref:hypothetical protein n=1 Tax=Natronomonas sp. LN261 TaxID=2750669 RepID=UPI0015EE7023|nr:hypothetical protein [Natronomonas sp. LN261]